MRDVCYVTKCHRVWHEQPEAGIAMSVKSAGDGFSENGLPDLATAVDGVLKEQMDRLTSHLALAQQ